jgi:hypothetical protein
MCTHLKFFHHKNWPLNLVNVGGHSRNPNPMNCRNITHLCSLHIFQFQLCTLESELEVCNKDLNFNRIYSKDFF